MKCFSLFKITKICVILTQYAIMASECPESEERMFTDYFGRDASGLLRKKLYLLANSGCLNDCPSHVFHDNLVAHEMEVDADDFRPFEATCWRYLESAANRS